VLSDCAPQAPQAKGQKLQLVLVVSEARPAASPFLGSLFALAFPGIIPLEANLVIEAKGQGGSL